MTNKQAQITINAIKFMLDNAQYSEDVEGALNMAINALTAQPDLQQTCNQLATDTISRQEAIDLVEGLESARLKGEIDLLYPKVVKGLIGLPSAQPEQAVKGCRNCKYGKYNDFWKTHFCYNPNECTEWNLWEPSAQPDISEYSDKLWRNAYERGKRDAQTERPKGKWILVKEYVKIAAYKCSECGRSVWDDTGYSVMKDYPFCHCGAEMIGVEDGQ